VLSGSRGILKARSAGAFENPTGRRQTARQRRQSGMRRKTPAAARSPLSRGFVGNFRLFSVVPGYSQKVRLPVEDYTRILALGK